MGWHQTGSTYGAGCFFTLLYSIYCEIEYYYKKTKYLMVATVVVTVINIVTNYIMIKQYGYTMAAWTTLFSYICYFAFRYFLSRKFTGEDVFKLKSNIPALIETVVIAVAASFFREQWIVRWLLALVLCLGNLFYLRPFINQFRNYRKNKKIAK